MFNVLIEEQNVNAESTDPVVKILTLTIRSPDREDMVLTVPENGKPTSKGPWFTLKEGSKYTLIFTFRVTNNIVSGLRYSNMVWKTGIKGISSFTHSFSATASTQILEAFVLYYYYFSNSLWRTVYSRKEMLGTFSPQAEPYNHVMFEETAPSGLLVRGSYSVKSKVPKKTNY